jgi:hypothetical protein
MSLWLDKTRGDWRYKFSLLKRTYAGGGFATKGQAAENRDHEVEIARLKGEIEAIETAQVKNGCLSIE